MCLIILKQECKISVIQTLKNTLSLVTTNITQKMECHNPLRIIKRLLKASNTDYIVKGQVKKRYITLMISKWERKAAIKTNASFASNSSFAELVISLVLTLPRLTHNGSNTEVTLDVRLGLGRFLVLLVSIQPNEGTILVEFVQLQITLIFPQAIIVVIDDVFLILVVIDRIVRTSIIIPAKIKQNLFMK